MQQHRPALERLAAPLRLRKIARRQIADVPARLVSLPAGGEIAAQEMQHAGAGLTLAVMRIERARAAKGRQRLIEAADILQRKAEIEMAGGKIRHQGDGLAAGGLGRLGAPARAQRVAEVAVGLDIVGLELHGLLETPRGFLEPLQLAERDAEIIDGLTVIGLQRQHPSVARLRVGKAPALAQQVAELVMRLDESGIERDGGSERRLRVRDPAGRPQRKAEVMADVGPLGAIAAARSI